MKYLLSLISLILCMQVIAGETTMIEKLDKDTYSICISDLEKFEDVFEANDITLDGQNFEAAIIEFCDQSSQNTDNLDFDSESDMFCVYASKESDLFDIQASIKTVLSDPNQLKNSLLYIEVEEYDNEEMLRLYKQQLVPEYTLDDGTTIKTGMVIKHHHFGQGKIKEIWPGNLGVATITIIFKDGDHHLISEGLKLEIINKK